MKNFKKEITTNEFCIFSGSKIPEGMRTASAKDAQIYYYTAPGHDNSVLKRSLLEQWVRASMEEIKKCSSYGEAHQAWENAPTMSFVKLIALEKMLSLTESKKRILGVFRNSPEDSFVKHLAFEKYQKLFIAA